MAFADAAALARFAHFRDRVQVAMVTAAKDIASEEPSDTERYRLRRALAVNVLADPDSKIDSFAWGVTSNPAIAYGSSDSDIQYTVNSIWDGIAGAPPAP